MIVAVNVCFFHASSFVPKSSAAAVTLSAGTGCYLTVFGRPLDDVVKSLEILFSVIPAKAGIQSFQTVINSWTPVFTGVTTFQGSRF